jgi:hypothetical protein
MSIDPQTSVNPASYTGRYYALPLRGRLTPYEGGTFSAAPNAIPEGQAKTAESAEHKPGFSFAGFLDLINPLQHIPIVSSLYRRLTGDEINPVSRIAGGALFFGVAGLAGALVSTILQKVSGKDPGDHVMTALLGDKDQPSPAPDGPDDDANNALAAAPQPGPLRGSVTVHPKGVSAPQTLDAATLDALARTIGSAEPLAHLAQPIPAGAGSDKSAAAKSNADRAAATSYNDALIRMQQGLDQYQARTPNQISSSAN